MELGSVRAYVDEAALGLDSDQARWQKDEPEHASLCNCLSICLSVCLSVCLRARVSVLCASIHARYASVQVPACLCACTSEART